MPRGLRRMCGSRLRALFIIFLMIGGMASQLALSALALPGEVPRAALERLTGLLLTDPDAMPEDCPMVAGAGSARVSDGHAHRHPGHDPHQACAICIFLTMAAVLPASTPMLPLVAGIGARIARSLLQPRAPPGFAWTAAYPRGPPGTV